MNLSSARQLMHEWTASPALRVHMECVASCMGAYAEKFHPGDAAQKDRWIVCGLLHDFDYEKHPSKEEHPFIGVKHLREHHPPPDGVDIETIEAILGHAEYSGTPRATPMQKSLFAVDELAGFIVACCKVRPNGIADLEPSSVKKKLKDKAFAAAVSREDINKGIAEMGQIVSGLDATEHIRTCIEAIKAERERLGV
jgi:predicted hydrolase (HD superfamily)